MSKLDILVAEKVMGWHIAMVIVGEEEDPAWGTESGKRTFHPETCLDDALLCLERAANGEEYRLMKVSEDARRVDGKNAYGCGIYPNDIRFADTFPLAMCLCALRFVGVPESLITQAME